MKLNRGFAAVAAMAGLTALTIPARAVVVEVEVPEFTGTYENTYQSATVHLPSTPTVIHGVSFRARGTTTLASYSCDGPDGYGPPRPVATQVNVELIGGTVPWSGGRNNEASGAFDWIEAMESCCGSTWAFLLDGEAEVGFNTFGFPAIPECVLVGPTHSTTIESITLLVDGEWSTPARKASWGQMKSIYR